MAGTVHLILSKISAWFVFKYTDVFQRISIEKTAVYAQWSCLNNGRAAQGKTYRLIKKTVLSRMWRT